MERCRGWSAVSRRRPAYPPPCCMFALYFSARLTRANLSPSCRAHADYVIDRRAASSRAQEPAGAGFVHDSQNFHTTGVSCQVCGREGMLEMCLSILCELLRTAPGGVGEGEDGEARGLVSDRLTALRTPTRHFLVTRCFALDDRLASICKATLSIWAALLTEWACKMKPVAVPMPPCCASWPPQGILCSSSRQYIPSTLYEKGGWLPMASVIGVSLGAPGSTRIQGEPGRSQ